MKSAEHRSYRLHRHGYRQTESESTSMRRAQGMRDMIYLTVY